MTSLLTLLAFVVPDLLAGNLLASSTTFSALSRATICGQESEQNDQVE